MNSNEAEQRLAELHNFFREIVSIKGRCKHNIRRCCHLRENEEALAQIRLRATDTIFNRTNLVPTIDYYLHHHAHIPESISGEINTPDSIPGRICYMAPCNPGAPKSGQAGEVYAALRKFGIRERAIKAKTIGPEDNIAVLGVSFLSAGMMDEIIDKIVERKVRFMHADRAALRDKVIKEITCDPLLDRRPTSPKLCSQPHPRVFNVSNPLSLGGR